MGYLDITSRVRQVQGKTSDNTFPIPLKKRASIRKQWKKILASQRFGRVFMEGFFTAKKTVKQMQWLK